MSAPGNANRAVHAAVVDLVATFLQHAGIDAMPRPYYRDADSISDELGRDFTAPDISCVPGVAVNVTSRLRHRLGDDLDHARRTAVINSAPVGAFVQWRGGRGVADSFVVMSLADFSKLVGGSPPP